MTRAQLEHVIRVAADIAADDEIVVIGSQAIYAQGVGPETAVLPDGWRDRLVAVRNANTRGATGLCLEVHDLAVAKAVAGREKDGEFLRKPHAMGSYAKTPCSNASRRPTSTRHAARSCTGASSSRSETPGSDPYCSRSRTAASQCWPSNASRGRVR
jgi:hypothetical protein